MIKYLFFITLLVLLSSCGENIIDTSNNTKREISPGNIPINYYADKTVKSLIVPPDLTKPSTQNSFRLSEYVTNVNETIIDFSGSQKAKDKATKILEKNPHVEVARKGQRRWLIINKNSDLVWEIAKDFLKKQGFALKKTNKKIGLIETDFLENYPEIPEQSLGFIRSMISKAITARYTLPIIDKYRIRIEPLNDDKTELHLSLFSMQEKLARSGNVESTIWETYEKDVALETEMLYRLMLYISGDQASSKEKILNAKSEKRIETTITDGFNGFAKLTFNDSVINTWDNLSWALDQLNIDIQDKDIKEKSFYIRAVRSSDRGILSSLLGEEALYKNFQIIVRSIDENNSDVLFTDVSGENEVETKEFSYELFEKIQKLF